MSSLFNFDCVYDNSSGNFSKIIQDNESMNQDYKNYNVYVDKKDFWISNDRNLGFIYVNNTRKI